MNMNVTCPQCGLDNAYFELIDEEGSHYSCPDCDYEWTDGDDSIEDSDEEE